MRRDRACGEILTQAIGLVEGFRELLGGHVEANMAQVMGGRQAAVRNLVDVKGELGLHVGTTSSP